MEKFLLSIGILLIFNNGKAQNVFKIELANQPSEKEISIKTIFTNNSKKPINIPKYRSVDYVREKVVMTGAYIVEFQKYMDASFKLLSPTADIDPFANREFIILKKGKSISDTLNIQSMIFRTKNEDRFSPGRYRIRVAFNTNGWRDKKSEFTKWLEFMIK